MFPTARLLQAARVTFFTRAGCGLCDTAKNTVAQLQKRRPFEYSEIDIMVPGNKEWKGVYEFDVPVLHVQSANTAGELSDPKKLFHRFTEKEVETLVDDAETAQ
jgi:glutaredoxin